MHSGRLGVTQIRHSLHQLRCQAQLYKAVRLFFNSSFLLNSNSVNRFINYCLSSNIQSGSVQSSIRSGQLALLIQKVVHVFSREKRPSKAGIAFLTVMETSTVKRFQRRAQGCWWAIHCYGAVENLKVIVAAGGGPGE